MYVARRIGIFFLIVALLVAYVPQARSGMSEAWQAARPGVVAFMDGVYAVVRSLVAGSDATDGIHNDPPEVDYDLIITMRAANL